MLNLFTFLVFLLVFIGVYTLRAVSKRQRRADAIEARLLTLRAALLLGPQSPRADVAGVAESIALPGQYRRVIGWAPIDRVLHDVHQQIDILGWRPTLKRRLSMCAAGALFGALMFGRFTGLGIKLQLPVAAVLFVVIAIYGFQTARAKHLQLLAKHLPEVIDTIARVCRAGVPVHSAFAIAAESLEGFLAQELRQIDQWLRLGLPLRQVIQDSARRVPLREYRFFAVILIISQESGGRLGDTLTRLSATLRSRAELQMKVQSKTSEARASAKIVSLLVPGVLAYMYINAPADFRFLFNDPVGIKVMTYAAGSVCLGLLITQLMVRRVA